jgi:hypothetical protein
MCILKTLHQTRMMTMVVMVMMAALSNLVSRYFSPHPCHRAGLVSLYLQGLSLLNVPALPKQHQQHHLTHHPAPWV